MSFQFLPLYTGDYLRDTRHLSPLKHGIYLLLIMHCWDQKGPLPLDEQECAGIANCRSSDEIESLRYVLDRFFVRMDDGHYNSRMQREIERAEVLSHARSAAGRIGYQAKAKQLLSKSQAIAKQVPLPPPPHHTPTPTPTPNEKHTSAYSASFVQFWACWPSNERKGSKPKCAQAWNRQGCDAKFATIIAHVESMKLSDGWMRGFVPAPLTYLNQARWEGAESASTPGGMTVL